MTELALASQYGRSHRPRNEYVAIAVATEGQLLKEVLSHSVLRLLTFSNHQQT